MLGARIIHFADQMWLDNPDSNYGWLVLGAETENRTPKRFDRNENETEANRPFLTIKYPISEP